MAWLPWALIEMMEKLEMCQMYAERAITGEIKTTPVKVILAEAELQTVATRATQLSTIAIEKSHLMPHTNQRKQITTAEVHQPTKKTSWIKIASDVWRSIFGPTPPERTPGAPITMATNWKPRFRGGWCKVR